MGYFGRFYLDKEKDIIVDLCMDKEGQLSYVLRTPNHQTGNLITNLAHICDLPLSYDHDGMKIIQGVVPCYIDGSGREVYIFRLRDTKVANIFPDGRVERKASIPAIAKTLMSQTKDYHLDFEKTVVKTYILRSCKFHTDLHTHMNANLAPDVLIALGIAHQIRYPLYYIKKLDLRLNSFQVEMLRAQRKKSEAQFRDCGLQGKYLDRRIDDNTFINFADLILNNLDNAAWNIPRIRASLAVMKDGQAVFTDLEKVYLYRYVFTKAEPASYDVSLVHIDAVPDEDIVRYLKQMEKDRRNPDYKDNTLFQDLLLWTARTYQSHGIDYVEISDTTLVKKNGAAGMLQQVHDVMPAVTRETGVTIRFLAALRRIALTIVKDQVSPADYLKENLEVLRAVSVDPYVAGSDIVGEEINDILDLRPLIHEIVRTAATDPDFTVRIHAGENDSLPDNVANSIRCVREALAPGQKMPHVRLGHGLYTANLSSAKGKQLLKDLKDTNTVLEFQITSNVRLNNLSDLSRHPLRQYLRNGILCVQGTDGGALYGTDSVDEELCLEKMLNLSQKELEAMCRAEAQVRKRGLAAFARKQKQEQAMVGTASVQDFIQQRIEASKGCTQDLILEEGRKSSAECLKDLVKLLPEGKVPVVVAGGSFNNDRHQTRMLPQICRIMDELLEKGDPDRMYFIIGSRFTGYERYLLEQNHDRYEIYSYVPAMVSDKQEKEIRKAGVHVRAAIEPSSMGLYKSITHEVFKRIRSIFLALDGNSAAANMIQEAKNYRHKSTIFVNGSSRILKAKAQSLKGYAVLLEDLAHPAESILEAADKAHLLDCQ